METLVKNRNFGQKSKFGTRISWSKRFWSKIEIVVKNPNFGQKSK